MAKLLNFRSKVLSLCANGEEYCYSFCILYLAGKLSQTISIAFFDVRQKYTFSMKKPIAHNNFFVLLRMNYM